MPASRLLAACLCTLLALAITATGASAKSSTKHNLSIYKVEKHVTIDEQDTETHHLICQNGDYVTDGMWRVDNVSSNPQLDDDGPYNRFFGIDVLQANSTSPQEYTFKIRNNTEDDAQLKLFIVCAGRDTAGDTHQHGLHVYTPPGGGVLGGPGNVSGGFGTGRCDPGDIAIAPGYQVISGFPHDKVKIFRSYPDHPDNRGWSWGFYVYDPAVNIRVSIRCLRLKLNTHLGHHHKLFAKQRPPFGTVTTAFRNKERYKLDCDDHEKAIVGGFDVNLPGWPHSTPWLWYLGMDPQPKSRVFTIANTWPHHELQMKLIATCLKGVSSSKRL